MNYDRKRCPILGDVVEDAENKDPCKIVYFYANSYLFPTRPQIRRHPDIQHSFHDRGFHLWDTLVGNQSDFPGMMAHKL